jgi:uncharacterized membrane protein
MTRPMTGAGILLGFSLGGILDAIVIHLILQWHHVASNRIDPTTLGGLRENLVLDGIFFAVMWVFVVIGIWLLWREGPRHARPVPGRVLAGAMLLGWGAFHLFDSVVAHSLLQLHHVYPDAPLVGDLAFLAIGIVLLATGWWLLRSAGLRPRREP